MPAASVQVQANRVRRVAITIPANAATAVTLESLAVAALNAVRAGEGDRERPWIMGGSVSGNTAAYIAGDSTTSLPLVIGVGAVYYEAAVNVLAATYVKAAAGGAVAAVLSIYLAGDGGSN